jgi:hypothetical protein
VGRKTENERERMNDIKCEERRSIWEQKEKGRKKRIRKYENESLEDR